MPYAEELLPLLLDEHTGRPVVESTRWDLAIGGAMLLDLVGANRVSMTSGTFGAKKISVNDGAYTGDPVYDEAMRLLSKRSSVNVQGALRLVGRPSREALSSRLEEQNLVVVSGFKAFGLFPVKRWYPQPGSGTTQLRYELAAVLVGGADPDERLGGLIALISAVDAAPKLVAGNKRELRARAKEIARGNWAGDAVRTAVQSIGASLAAASAGGGGDGGGS